MTDGRATATSAVLDFVVAANCAVEIYLAAAVVAIIPAKRTTAARTRRCLRRGLALAVGDSYVFAGFFQQDATGCRGQGRGARRAGCAPAPSRLPRGDGRRWDRGSSPVAGRLHARPDPAGHVHAGAGRLTPAR